MRKYPRSVSWMIQPLHRPAKLVMVLLAVCASSPAQHSGHSGTLPVAVDGSKTPGLIPDQLAYRHFLMALAEPQSANPEAIARRSALLATTGLSAGDQQALVSALNGLRERLDANYLATEQAATDDSLAEPEKTAAITTLRAQENLLLDGLASGLKTELSYDGWLRLDAYVKDHVKRRIVIYGSPLP